MAPRLKRLLWIALAVAGLDQLVKALVVWLLPPGGVTIIPHFADLVLVYNRGAAFGMLSGLDQGRWLLVAVTLAALTAAVWLVMGTLGRSSGVATCLGLIAGGALGNLIDRLRLGLVVDFVDLHVAGWHWPAFNVADAAITVAGLYLAWLLARGRA